MAGLYAPLPTLRRRPRGRLRTDRGRRGLLLLPRSGLSPHTPCQSPGALTRVAACPLARSPYAVPAIRRLQTLRLLHACSGRFRLERSPGGACTHWKSAALSRRTWIADVRSGAHLSLIGLPREPRTVTNFRNFDLNLLLVLDGVLREGTLSNAAKALNVSQPTISSSLAKLREILQDELFVRSGNGMQPTPRALALKEPIQRVLAAVKGEILDTVRFDPATEIRPY